MENCVGFIHNCLTRAHFEGTFSTAVRKCCNTHKSAFVWNYIPYVRRENLGEIYKHKIDTKRNNEYAINAYNYI
jgi:hypothetical protein